MRRPSHNCSTSGGCGQSRHRRRYTHVDEQYVFIFVITAAVRRNPIPCTKHAVMIVALGWPCVLQCAKAKAFPFPVLQSLLAQMVLLTSYRDLQKVGRSGTFLNFTPLRAAGLSLEQGFKAARDKGLGAVTLDDLNQVRVAGEGKLRVKTGRQWRAASSCELRLQPADAALSLSLLRQKRAVLSELGINVWCVDRGGRNSNTTYDLLADFSTTKNFGVQGRLWVELKVLGQAGWNKELENCKQEMEAALARERQRDATLGGALLLAAKVGQQGGTYKTEVVAKLKVSSKAGWQNVAGEMRKPKRTCSKHKHLPLASVWQKMEWVETARGQKVGLLGQFLDALGRPAKNAGQQADTFNKLLQRGCHSGRVFEAKVKGKCGRLPWVATKETLAEVYRLL